LFFQTGLCPSVGIGSHISGGGFGILFRKHGLAADHVDAYLIDVNRRILNRKSIGEDIFWAIRGGSAASFGVILAWKIMLVRVPPIVTVFTIHKTLEEGATKLIHRWQHREDKLHIMEPYGGRMSEISESEIPFPHRKGNLYNIPYIVKWEVNSIEESNKHIK